MKLKEAWTEAELRVADKLSTWDPLYHQQVDLIARCFPRRTVVGSLFSGLGYTSKRLVDNGHLVYGIDISKDALKYGAARTGNSKQFKPVLADVYNLPLRDESFGGLCFSLEMPNIDKLAREATRVLRREGILAFTIQYNEQTTEQVRLKRAEFVRVASSLTREEMETMDRMVISSGMVHTYNPAEVIGIIENQGMKMEVVEPVLGNFCFLFKARKF